MKVNLIRPKFKKVVTLEVGFSWKAMFLGPVLPFKEGFFFISLLHIVFSIITFGCFWIYYARNYNKSKIISLLEKGYEPENKISSEILIDNKIITSERNDKIYFSRLGSVDHLFFKE